jgi:DNA-binding response OmpR family regulator
MASHIVAVQVPFRAGVPYAGVSHGDEQQLNATPAHSRILLISDDPLMLRALDRLLRKAGYAVEIRERSEDYPAICRAANNGTDVALTIVDVPDEWSRLAPGQLVVAHRRPGRDEDRILWITNATDVVDRPDFYLIKPFTASQFLSKVDAVIKLQSPTVTR